VNGGGFCCDDAPGLRAGAIGNGNDNPEIYQYYYHSDHLGSTSLITNLDGEIVQYVEYVPFGEVFIEERNNRWNTPYLFNAKELDEETGLYYFGNRYYSPEDGTFRSVDRFAEKFPWQSPYCMASNNPVNFIDVNGDSTAVLNLGGAIGHTAMLVQNDEGKWQYYSMNGDWVYRNTDGVAGGKPYHDVGEKTFNSPQEFLGSSYNAEGNKEQIMKNEVNNYGFKEAYILPTTSEQDKAIKEAFVNIANNENYSLGIKSSANQCAIVTQRSLNAAGINTTEQVFHFYDGMTSTGFWTNETPYMPNKAFRAIIRNNPNGTYLKNK
jgi:RHS repeat-associated protein